jgi:hypothetical protein
MQWPVVAAVFTDVIFTSSYPALPVGPAPFKSTLVTRHGDAVEVGLPAVTMAAASFERPIRGSAAGRAELR